MDKLLKKKEFIGKLNEILSDAEICSASKKIKGSGIIKNDNIKNIDQFFESKENCFILILANNDD